MMNNFMGTANPFAMLAQLQSNPLAALRAAGFNIPQNMNSPQDIVQYLAQSGQVTQAQLNAAQQAAQMFRR